ncbi:chemotaxis protein CheW [Clostridium sp. MF28]|uniref:chemotaxis protein CheW n=1 Tax=Clostridium TaxID=1485 RepID=UPI000CFA687F|nr:MULTISPECIES: chemotaxis protein CheW [Clostridium]AVK47949.1 chemotaxis protein CheW [Clostridium sp. MF28]PSM56998.1 chemotaxis protein CheW [Clostridium diolis]
MTEEQFVVFHIGKERYAVPIEQVNEIIGYAAPTKIPLSREYILGVINLRGRIIPIINLGQKICIKNKKRNDEQKIIIIEDSEGAFGAIVDEVEDVTRIPKDSIKKINYDVCNGNEYIIGIAKQDNYLIVILDLNLFWRKCSNEIYNQK